MGKTFYLTGDRSLDPANSVALAGKAVAQLLIENAGEPVSFLTGNSPSGVEAAIRFIVPASHLTVLERGTTPEGYVDFDTVHEKIKEIADSAIVLHGDPLGSRIGQSVSKVFPEDKVRFLLQEQ